MAPVEVSNGELAALMIAAWSPGNVALAVALLKRAGFHGTILADYRADRMNAELRATTELPVPVPEEPK